MLRRGRQGESYGRAKMGWHGELRSPFQWIAINDFLLFESLLQECRNHRRGKLSYVKYAHS